MWQSAGIKTKPFILCVGLLLSACEAPTLPKASLPQAKSPPQTTSAKSIALRKRYEKLENDLITRGLLRTDGGGLDTPFDIDDIVENFHKIAFFDEYTDFNLNATQTRENVLMKWQEPINLKIHFGPTMDYASQMNTYSEVANYIQHISQTTEHPIRLRQDRANFDVVFAGIDDIDIVHSALSRFDTQSRLKISNLISDLAPEIHCLVVTFSSPTQIGIITDAFAYIRAEHPKRLKQACIQEEIAQGLGLANDSPTARPSIFNDDDEFATLTPHDSVLLQILYDPEIPTGVTWQQAQPYLSKIVTRLNRIDH